MCGTPGCNLPDFHNGPCSTDAPSGKRPRVQAQMVCMGPPPPPPSPPRRRVPRPPPVARPESPPPQQSVHPNGLHRYYHALRWGVPLPDGPLAEDAGSDREFSEAWRLQEVDERLRNRANVAALQAELMGLWNVHIDALQPLASQRALPEACRRFACEHASRLAAQLREV